MTTFLKPIGADAKLIYQCDLCKIKHRCTVIEAKTPNFTILCSCGNVLYICTINKATINFEYIVSNGKLTSKAQQDAVSILQSQGYKNCIEIVKEVNKTGDTVEKLVRKAVIKYNEKIISSI